MNNLVDVVWQHSRYYGDMLSTAIRLHDDKEDYAAVLVLFNALELICKSVRENYNQSFSEDITYLKNIGALSEEEYEFLSDKDFGVRIIRNKMMHRNAYQYCWIDFEGVLHPLSETRTWAAIFECYAPRIIQILSKIVVTQYGI